jgi:hypothetical protein
MGEVLEFTGQSTAPVPPKEVLENAGKHDLESVMVIGFTKGGDLLIGLSDASIPNALFLMEYAKRELMSDDGE